MVVKVIRQGFDIRVLQDIVAHHRADDARERLPFLFQSHLFEVVAVADQARLRQKLVLAVKCGYGDSVVRAERGEDATDPEGKLFPQGEQFENIQPINVKELHDRFPFSSTSRIS
ncbi:MAG: hypothetical protein IT426_04505 [Pirellulales bacterium]|nr:hypothetical protein [Pirellulales bacterium]